MKAADRQGVIFEHTVIGNVHYIDRDFPVLTQLCSSRDVKGRVRGKIRALIRASIVGVTREAIGETRSVIYVSRKPASEW